MEDDHAYVVVQPEQSQCDEEKASISVWTIQISYRCTENILIVTLETKMIQDSKWLSSTLELCQYL